MEEDDNYDEALANDDGFDYSEEPEDEEERFWIDDD